MATASERYLADQRFFLRMAVGLALFIVFGFAQFAARGLVDLAAVPVWVHLHALVFVSWLALFATQNYLAATGSLALHRRLGWLGVALAATMVVLGSYTGLKAIELHRQPFFFSPPYFLALTQVESVMFGGIVAAAIVWRRDTEWHRRLMLTATVLLMEPALGRVLPMPLTGGEAGEWLACLIQLGVLGIVWHHDRKTRGAVHPALLAGMVLVVLEHGTVSLLAHAPPVIALAGSIAGN